MANTTAETKPKTASIPLKGKYLQEFVTLCNEDAAIKKTVTLSNPADADQPEFTEHLATLSESTVYEITKGLNLPGAIQFGIDFEDLRTKIRATAEKFTQNSKRDTSPKNPAQIEAEKSMVNHAVLFALKNFGSCLALQEHTEQNHIRFVTSKIKQEIIPLFKKSVDEKGPLTEEQKFAIGTQLMSDSLIQTVLHDGRKQRNSIIAPMEAEILFGKATTAENTKGIIGEMRGALAYLYKLDEHKHTERELLRYAENACLYEAAQKAGLKLPSTMDLGF